jgi:hypothetical protein
MMRTVEQIAQMGRSSSVTGWLKTLPLRDTRFAQATPQPPPIHPNLAVLLLEYRDRTDPWNLALCVESIGS